MAYRSLKFGEHIWTQRSGERLWIAWLISLILLAAVSVGCEEEDGVERQRVRLGGRTFQLELALAPPARFQGLSDRAELPENGGMLFVFPEARQLSFVMRRCLIPLDLIYLGPGGRIVSMHRMAVEPYDTPEDELKRYVSGWPAQFVIEIRGGLLDELGLRVGDAVALPLEELKARAK